MNPQKFFPLYLGMFIKPRRTLDLILNNDQKLKFGFLAFLFPSLGYTLFYIMAWYAGGSPSTFKPWLALPIENYFRYDIFLTFPGYYLSWVGAASTVFLVSRLLKSNGSFENTLVIIAFGLGVATWSSMFHDLTDALLSVTGVIDMKTYEHLLNTPTLWRNLLWTLYTIYFFWFISLFTIGIKKVHRFGTLLSICLALLGLAVFQTILLIFIR